MSGLPAAAALIEEALAASTAQGCVVVVEDSSEAEVRFAVNTVTTNGRRFDRRVTVISFIHSAAGVSVGSATRTGAVDLADLVAESEVTARAAAVADDASELLGGYVDSDFADPAPSTGFEVLMGALDSLPGVFARAGVDGLELAGFVDHRLATTWVGTSAGLRRRYVQPTGSLLFSARADGGARTSWFGQGSATMDDLDVVAAEGELRRRLAWGQRHIDLPAGRYETILPPGAAADMVRRLYWACNGRDAEDGKTVFSRPGGGTRLGERLSELPFRLSSDPHDPELACAPFLATTASSSEVSVFDNGADLTATNWIDDGVLRQLIYHRAGARAAGVPFAGPIENVTLTLPGATGDTNDLVQRTERGLLLTSLWYIRDVDPKTLLLTGLTRDGVYLIEHGEVVGQVNNFRFNESPVGMLSRCLEAGATVRTRGREAGDYFNRTKIPPLRIAEFNMSSVSPAS